jgi:hypothetical protein
VELVEMLEYLFNGVKPNLVEQSAPKQTISFI